MQIICKKRFQFTDYEITIDPRSKEKVAKALQTFIASPSTRPVAAPDWIVNDALFELAMSDGSLIAIGDIPAKLPKPTVEEPLQQAAQPTQRASELSEADLEMLNRPIGELTGQPAPD